MPGFLKHTKKKGSKTGPIKVLTPKKKNWKGPIRVKVKTSGKKKGWKGGF